MPEEPNIKLREPLPPPTAVTPCELPYAELEVVTNFSFLRGASHPDELVYQAASLGYRAIAVTDFNTLAGVVRAHSAAKKCGLKLLVGARLVFEDAPDLLVWATDRAAYGRLCRLLTLGKRRTEKGGCQLFLEDFLELSEGLLAATTLTSSRDTGVSPVPNAKGLGHRRFEQEAAEGTELVSNCFSATSAASCSTISSHPHGRDARVTNTLLALRDVLGDRISLVATRSYGNDDESHLENLLKLSREVRIPLLATNGVYYHGPNRRPLQDALTCVRHGCTIREAGFRLFPNGERYLKSPQQMHRLFRECPQAIDRGIGIVERCSFNLGELQYEYPDELVPPDQTPIQYLSSLAWAGAETRYPKGIPEKVRHLLNHELKLIEQLKFEPFFLTVYDLVKFARSRGILCQGRGSAANSAVCYCIGVTSVNPAEIDLLFERFISAARNEPPDIDVDFEHERREEVIQYVYQKYGRDRCGIAAEVISYRGRSAIRDIGKVMGLSLDMVDSMAKKLDWWHRGSLSDKMILESGLDPKDRTIRQVIGLTTELLGFPRHLGQHVGGMVMTRGLLCELVPIENAAMEDRTVIEWDKDDIDELGILKVDVLALGMLTCISKAFHLIKSSCDTGGPPVRKTIEQEVAEAAENASNNISALSATSCSKNLSCCGPSTGETPVSQLALHHLSPTDPNVYDMICDADTIGVFQIESRAQMSMLPRLKPRTFYDLVIEVAIVRPGPIQGNMVHPYLRRRNGEEKVTYPSPQLEKVLGSTLGVPLFQEQAMKIAMVGAGFSGAEADNLRRAMAAWRKNGELLKFHSRIVEGMLKNNYTREFAEQCFEQIKGFGEYGFPESHSASFALLVYASSWIKRYHPATFCAALLNSQPMGFYQPAQIVRDAREHGVEVRPVDVNFSEWDCTLEKRHEGTEARRHEGTNKSTWGLDGPAVRLGFREIKGFRQQYADALVAARTTFESFSSVEELQQANLPSQAIRQLAEADAFSSLNLPRRSALWDAMELNDIESPLFDSPLRAFVPSCLRASLPPMPLPQEVKIDYETVGLSLKKHPVSFAREILSSQRILSSAQINETTNGRWVKVAGLVLIRQRPGTASGIVFITLEDETGIVNLIVRPNIYDKFRPAARHAALLQCDGYLERQGQVVHIMAKRLFDRSELIRGYEISSRDFH